MHAPLLLRQAFFPFLSVRRLRTGRGGVGRARSCMMNTDRLGGMRRGGSDKRRLCSPQTLFRAGEFVRLRITKAPSKKILQIHRVLCTPAGVLLQLGAVASPLEAVFWRTKKYSATSFISCYYTAVRCRCALLFHCFYRLCVL